MRRIPARVLFGLALALLAGAGGCASDQAQPPVCDSYAAVRTTVGHIRDVNVSENGLGQLEPYLTQLRGELAQFSTDARTQFATPAAAVRSSADALGTATRTALAEPNAANLAAVRRALISVRASWDDLRAAMAHTC